MDENLFVNLESFLTKGELNIQTGPFGTELKASDYSPEGVPVINVRNIGYRDEKLSDLEYLSEKHAQRLKKHRLEIGDIVFGRKGAVDRHLIVTKKQDGWIQGSDCIRIRLKSSRVDNDYLSYFFLTTGHKLWMEAQGSFGATMASLNQGIIQRITFPLRSIDFQRKTAAILAAYDRLIESNNRRIEILERIVEELYREWFIRFRYAGHDKSELIKGIPVGWKIQKIKSVVDRKGFGKIYREGDVAAEGNIVVIDQSTDEFLGFYEGIPEHLASEDLPIILFGDHSCKMQLMTTPFSLAENVVPFIAKGEMPTLFLYYLVKNCIETTEYKRHWTELTNKEVCIPPEALQKYFVDIIGKNVIHAEKLKVNRRRLFVIREKLLVRLMSGKIDLNKLDIKYPENMIAEVANAQLHQ